MICNFIPPHMTKKVAEDHRDFAASFKMDTSLRADRTKRTSVQGPIRMYDAKNGRVIPGHPFTALTESDDASAISSYAADASIVLGATTFPDGVVRYGKQYANAFFNGSYLVFGEGDGEIFGNFTASRDIFAHEFGHALVSLGPKLAYAGESGALNEHLADVIGVCVQQSVSKDVSDWRIGQEILLDGVSAVRDMLKPGTAYDNALLGKDPQPDHMSGYRKMSGDNGGVHINSGIPNKAFAALCVLTEEPSWGRPLAMWRRTMQDLGPRSTFLDLARGTWRHSGGLNPAVREAWKSVGIEI